MKKIYLAWVMLLSLGSTLWIEKVSAGSVHVIRNNSDWIAFRDAVANAKGQYRVDARLEADFSTSAGIGELAKILPIVVFSTAMAIP